MGRGGGDEATGDGLETCGIEEGGADELLDVIPASFMHCGVDQLMANTLPMLVLGFMAALRGSGRVLEVALTIIVVSGLGVWVTAPEHIL
ncbi:rhomboid family intramembrane serine protease [Streptomyces armeniacus]|uniref:Rhomboid family intramembrane serine protease n=1 Tax=Streptomyces armeniacus TaxID=83291 RepID=A0A345XXP1_9ACTN|nr:rhomboid family intramembrane serine protease [Streptomyces armeniacus]AXK36407.1 rhomboid family intramembrane serine protease [Streptomyces armeniacus]